MQRDHRRRTLLRQLGQRIRKLRQSRGLSQEALADACGLHRTYVGAVERGENNVTILSLDTVARALDATLADLVTGVSGVE